MKQVITKVFVVLALALVLGTGVLMSTTQSASAHSSESSTTTQASTFNYCTYTYTYYYWWGTITYVPDCTLKTLQGYQVQSGIILLSGLIGGYVGASVAAIVMYNLGYAQDLSAHCGYGGVFVYHTWNNINWLGAICSYR